MSTPVVKLETYMVTVPSVNKQVNVIGFQNALEVSRENSWDNLTSVVTDKDGNTIAIFVNGFRKELPKQLPSASKVAFTEVDQKTAKEVKKALKAAKQQAEQNPVSFILTDEAFAAVQQTSFPRCARILDGIYTVTNTKTGGHRTFKIESRNWSKVAGKEDLKRTIYLLTGSNNESDYTGFGFVTETGINVWNKKKGQDGKKSEFEIYAAMAWKLFRGDNSGFENCTVDSACCCYRCGRLLTDPISIQTGIGPVCRTK